MYRQILSLFCSQASDPSYHPRLSCAPFCPITFINFRVKYFEVLRETFLKESLRMLFTDMLHNMKKYTRKRYWLSSQTKALISWIKNEKIIIMVPTKTGKLISKHYAACTKKRNRLQLGYHSLSKVVKQHKNLCNQ